MEDWYMIGDISESELWEDGYIWEEIENILEGVLIVHRLNIMTKIDKIEELGLLGI